ncbi:MAG: DUF3604 domain-containing protein [Myxococcota bacterium]|nr:DUF3604 domain-containing protein [Myxococcota bacterium]
MTSGKRLTCFVIAALFMWAPGDRSAEASQRTTAPAEEPSPPTTTSGTLPEQAIASTYREDREACAVRDPLRKAYWGELHVHSGDSMDAYMQGIRGTPDDIYRFARGESILTTPTGPDGQPSRALQLERPLDFAALTDHASYLGELALCTRPDSPLYDSASCRVYRDGDPEATHPLGELGIKMAAITRPLSVDTEIPSRNAALCKDDFAICIQGMQTVWEEQQAAAERHYDRTSECRFTTFHGYEYSATPALSKVHHNVIFRNAIVPQVPIAWVDEPDIYGLFEKLRDQCTQAGTGCDVITIPHNSNLSSGRMFKVTGKELPKAEQRARARLRAEIEPLAEIHQIKGNSECRNGMYGVAGGPDEFCDYIEWGALVEEDCKEGSGSGAMVGRGCTSRTDFLRYTLLEGLREKKRIGVNPYKLGMIAATDTHDANPGDTEEFSYSGWFGTRDDTLAKRLEIPTEGDPMRPLSSNPGGLAGIWAEENSRDSLFDAMKRRETFGTSGTRLTARFFGGWGLPDDLCNDPNLVARGYIEGVPMGRDLPPRKDRNGPSFLISALRDPGAPGREGGLLQRAQVIKGWVDTEGVFQQRVYDAAGGPNNASVDLNTCEPRGEGNRSLCSVWHDPEFEPAVDAVYYLRVLENPSCRWNQHHCAALPETDRPAACHHPDVIKTVQERLWTSPIWYEAN